MNAKQDTLATVESGNICTSLGNKKLLVTATDSKLKVQRFDDDGSSITDSWLDQLSLDWNADTNKATLNVAADLAVNGDLVVTGSLTAPISAATQTAFNAKAPLASPTFTGTVGGITKAMVCLTLIT